MKGLLFYGLQMLLASGILYGYYHLFLRNNVFHRYNRFYLLAATLLSVTIPLLDIPLYLSSTGDDPSVVWQTLSAISPGETDANLSLTAAAPVTHGFRLDPVFLTRVIYIVIAALAFSRILLSLARIRRIARNNPVEKQGNIYFVQTTEPGTPFSFFRWLFWNRKIDLDTEDGQQIFRHELFHIRQGHSRDILFMELLTAVFWINPFFHLAKKELRAIHEFLADEHAVSGKPKWQYAEMLLMQILNTRQPLVHPFFHNTIKRRIAMITNSPQTSFRYLRKLLVLPVAVLALGLAAFNLKNKKEPVPTAGRSLTVLVDAGHGGDDAGAVAADGTSEKEITLALAQRIATLNDDPNIRIVLNRNTDVRKQLQGTVEMAKHEKADLFISLHISTSPEKETTQSGFRVFISGKEVIYKQENEVLANILRASLGKIFPVEQVIRQQNKGIYVLDKAPCPAVLVECGYLNNANDLAYLKTDKGQEAIAGMILHSIAQYSSTSTGTIKTGVPSVTGTIKPEPGVINRNTSSSFSDKLIVVDGKVQGREEGEKLLSAMDPSGISSVSVLKGETAVAKYGERGKNGVIEIITKAGAKWQEALNRPFVKGFQEFERQKTDSC